MANGPMGSPPGGAVPSPAGMGGGLAGDVGGGPVGGVGGGPAGGDPEMAIHEAVAIELLQLVPRIVDIVRGGPAGSSAAADLGLPSGGPMV